MTQAATALRAAETNGMNLRTVSIPGFNVSPDLTFSSVKYGTFDNEASSRICGWERPPRALRTWSTPGIVALMGAHPTGYGGPAQPQSVGFHDYRLSMPPVTSKNVLWQNVLALMVREFGKENVTKFAAWAKIGVGSVLRIREQETSVGLDILEKIAKKSGVKPWQLLVPDLDVANPPMLAKDAEGIRALVANINASQEALSGMLRIGGNTHPADLEPSNVIEMPEANPNRLQSGGLSGRAAKKAATKQKGK